MNNTTVYTVQTRRWVFVCDFSVLADAISYGLSQGVEFDVSVNSGAIVWAWEMRP